MVCNKCMVVCDMCGVWSSVKWFKMDDTQEGTRIY